jgi:16S rRNA (uracil1498-N3)-methyltransferase
MLVGPLLIGPEGDFSLDEVALAENSGYSSISLGDYRLRTETAALLAVFHASIA